MVTTYPVLYHHTANQIDLQITLELVLLFIKNFIFITVLAIMFDIKDYAADNNQQLKTFVVRIGLRKTIFAIIIPLTVVGFTISILYEWQQQFSTFRMILNSLIFPLILLVAYTLHNRKSILFYLIVIDGLMLVKAICGICGIMLG
jgi:4-hydroxybenzoate polyprenyltransferase